MQRLMCLPRSAAREGEHAGIGDCDLVYGDRTSNVNIIKLNKGPG